MNKNPVTRTFTIGAICSGSKASDDFPTGRRHSSAGIQALSWATGTAKSFDSHENIFPNILTPDSIPQFTIPSLSVQTGFRSLDKESNKEREGGSEMTPESSVSSACATVSSSASFPSFALVRSERKAERCVSDPLTKRRSLLQRELHSPCSYSETQHCLDPASKAALSLPHLTKITTPYGFVTLSQSPQMASEEALLCQAGPHRLNKNDKNSYWLSRAPGKSTEDIKGKSSHLSGPEKRLSKHLADSQSKRALQASAVSSTTVSSSPPPRQPDESRKPRFYEVIKKHFISRH